MDAEPFTVELGEFLYPQGYARYRHIPFNPQHALIVVTVLDGISSNMLEELLAEYPKDFHELTQHACRDLWHAVKHLSVPMEDVWIRIGRGLELSTTSYHTLVLQDDVVLVAIIPTAGRVDTPVLESCLSSTARGGNTMKGSTSFLQKKFHRPSHFALGLAHTHVFRGANTRDSDLGFLSSLKYATLSRESEGFCASGTTAHQKSQAPQRTISRLTIHMDDIRSWLAPPVAPHRVGHHVSTAPIDEATMRTVLMASPMGNLSGAAASPAPQQRAAPTPTVVYRPLTPRRDPATRHTGRDTPPLRGDGGDDDTRLFKPFKIAAETTPFRGARPPVEATVAEHAFDASYMSSDTEDPADVVHVTRGSVAARRGGGGAAYSLQPSPSANLSRMSSASGTGAVRRVVPAPTHFPTSQHRWEERQARAPSLYN